MVMDGIKTDLYAHHETVNQKRTALSTIEKTPKGKNSQRGKV